MSDQSPSLNTDYDQQGSIDDAEEMNPELVDDEELENQDWTLGQQKEKVVERFGMKWHLKEPADEHADRRIGNLIQTLHTNPGSKETFRMWAEEFIESPTITEERWESMMPRERYMIGDMVLEFFGVVDFFDEGDIEQFVQEDREQEGLSEGDG